MGKFQRLLARVAQALEKAKISYMVIGGQAVLVHGRPRFTGDIDVTLGVDVDRLEEVRNIAGQLGLHPQQKEFEYLAKQTNVFVVVDEATSIKIDFIFSFSQYEKEAIKRTRPIQVEGTNVQYASPEDILIHKLVAGRPVDIQDAKSILNIQRNLNRDYIIKWLKEYSGIVGRDLHKEFKTIDDGLPKN